MGKYPLPADTFPPLIVSCDDADALLSLSAAFLDDAQAEYDTFRTQQGGVMDETRWKPVKSRGGITVYQDRAVKITKASTFESDATVGSMAFSTKLHGVLGIGRMSGKLDDMMYGLLHPTTEMLKIKSVYMNDKCVDSKVLATITDPTPEDPMRTAHLKWAVNDFASPIISKFVRPRDFVYLETLGFRETADGERVGCVFIHSIEVQGIHELTAYQIVRASLSLCGLYRQLDDGQLEFYMKGFLDPAGEIHKGIAMPASAEAILSFSGAVYCASMKKLNWALKTQKSVVVDLANAQCTSCSAHLKAPNGKSCRSCEICMSRSCASCAEQRTLCFYSSSQRRAVTKRMLFCKRCVANAQGLSATEIASEEARLQHPFSAFELSSDSNQSGIVSPTDSASIDIQREFFG